MSYIDVMLAEKFFWFWILKFKSARFLSFLMSNITIILKLAEVLKMSLFRYH